MKAKKLLAAVAVALTMSGCSSSVQQIDTHNDQGKAVMGLDYRDFQTAAGEAVASMLQSGALNKRDGGRYVLVISRIINDTMQRIDTDQLIKKIRIDLLQSGRVVVTTAVGLDGPEDRMAMRTRELRQSGEFNQSTVAGKGQMIAPELSLSGKIIQRNIRVSSGTQQVEYYFQLTLTDIGTGLAFWEGESFIGKRGSNKSVSW
ncbi:penicillin-binding protein activator LpoB [Chlorobium sp. N1]|uniref:penicillin-binding protein activator LpoB n=1 Tax=Chlorobium sp. N1 TaxID=2491138 RepID=UPI00103BC131|nr:penicillin-binding protein activator LpoB [Chlorobium sp. N1]TCD48271.1 penicillin-binding protein activator LpoB [Chlorobium sp. N1]